MTATLTTAQAVANRTLLNIIGAEGNREKFAAALRTAKERCADDPKYEIEFRVNGVEFDFLEFEKMFRERLSRLLADAATELFEAPLSRLTKQVNEMSDAARNLSSAIRRAACEVLGQTYDPEDD